MSTDARYDGFAGWSHVEETPSRDRPTAIALRCR
jgi:hypothetical protein